MFAYFIRDNMRLLRIFSCQRAVFRCLGSSAVFDEAALKRLNLYLRHGEEENDFDNHPALNTLVQCAVWATAGSLDDSAQRKVAHEAGYLTINSLVERTGYDQEEIALALHHLMVQRSVRAVHIGKTIFYCAPKRIPLSDYFSGSTFTFPHYGPWFEAISALYAPERQKIMRAYTPPEDFIE
jgi:hypothetical protein